MIATYYQNFAGNTGLCLQIEGPLSMQSSLLWHTFAKCSVLPSTLPPNHTAYLCTIFSYTFASIGLGATPVKFLYCKNLSSILCWSYSLSLLLKLSNKVLPPDRTTFSQSLLLVSIGQLWIALSTISSKGCLQSEWMNSYNGFLIRFYWTYRVEEHFWTEESFITDINLDIVTCNLAFMGVFLELVRLQDLAALVH